MWTLDKVQSQAERGSLASSWALLREGSAEPGATDESMPVDRHGVESQRTEGHECVISVEGSNHLRAALGLDSPPQSSASTMRTLTFARRDGARVTWMVGNTGESVARMRRSRFARSRQSSRGMSSRRGLTMSAGWPLTRGSAVEQLSHFDPVTRRHRGTVARLQRRVEGRRRPTDATNRRVPDGASRFDLSGSAASTRRGHHSLARE